MVEITHNQPSIEATPIPSYLIRDVINGKPYYYKGYKEVLAKTKTIHDIIPSSTLQAEIIMYLNFLLTQALGIRNFRIYTSESGNHLAKNLNYGLDLAVYDRQVLSSDKINEYYATVPPELVVEVDIKVELEGTKEIDFIIEKTQSLLDYGTKRVIWVTSKTKKVLIATKGQDWLLRDWNNEFELMQGILANIGQYLSDNEVEI